MTEEESLAILNEVKELSDWMEEACGAECGTIEEMIAGTTDDAYEVIVTIGLTSGKEIVLHNRCFESFIKKMYKGDTLYCRDGLIYTDFIDYDAGDAYRQAKIVPSTVCYIDGRSVELNWPALYKQYMATRDIHEEEAGCELPSAEDIIEKQKVDLSYLNEVAKKKLADLLFFPNKGGIWPHIQNGDLILHQPNHNKKALGLLPDNQPETMAAKYRECLEAIHTFINSLIKL